MIRIRSRLSLAALAALMLPGLAAAQPPREPVAPLEYAVKIVCGRNPAVQPPPPQLAPGQYFTIVNIHNPNLGAKLTWKASAALLDKPGPVTPFKPMFGLAYDESIDLDCTSVRKWFAANNLPVPALLTGFLVIQSHQELDVVAVYTAGAASPNGLQVVTLHTERVPLRKLR